MKVTDFVRRTLRYRRERRDRLAAGWEIVGEGGGSLWELHRGWRIDHVITDVAIGCGGKFLWIKTAPPRPAELAALTASETE